MLSEDSTSLIEMTHRDNAGPFCLMLMAHLFKQCVLLTVQARLTAALKSSQPTAVFVLYPAGAITWHAHPHNAQYELYDPSLLAFSVDLVHDMDRRFGFAPKHTIFLVRLHGFLARLWLILALHARAACMT